MFKKELNKFAKKLFENYENRLTELVLIENYEDFKKFDEEDISKLMPSEEIIKELTEKTIEQINQEEELNDFYKDYGK